MAGIRLLRQHIKARMVLVFAPVPETGIGGFDCTASVTSERDANNAGDNRTVARGEGSARSQQDLG